MNALRLAHRYFEFSWKNWLDFWGTTEPTIDDLKILFLEDPFPRRQLIVDSECSFNQAYAEFSLALEKEERMGVKAFRPIDPEFPPHIGRYLPPERLSPLYYLRGAPLPKESDALAIVGTRYPSAFGVESAQNFAAYFSVNRVKIVSGLARGIDSIAHRENLEVGTVAILGGGVLDVYPRENIELAEKILARGGTLVSEFPTDQVTLPRNFPKRNEFIAALAAGTLVVEGKETSGSYITGRHSLHLGKHTVVLTQDYRLPAGRAAIQLIQDGALPVREEEEALHYIFARLGGFASREIPAKRAGKKEKRSAEFLN
jgi:DNA protecting protein DprA